MPLNSNRSERDNSANQQPRRFNAGSNARSPPSKGTTKTHPFLKRRANSNQPARLQGIQPIRPYTAHGNSG